MLGGQVLVGEVGQGEGGKAAASQQSGADLNAATGAAEQVDDAGEDRGASGGGGGGFRMENRATNNRAVVRDADGSALDLNARWIL